MNSWMKRRIERSRARCQQALLEDKKTTSAQSKSEQSEQAAPSLRTDSHHTEDK